MNRTCGVSMLSRIAASGQEPTHARHIVQASRLISMVPYGEPAGSAITACGTGACVARCSSASAAVVRFSAVAAKYRAHAGAERRSPLRQCAEVLGADYPKMLALIAEAHWRWCRRSASGTPAPRGTAALPARWPAPRSAARPTPARPATGRGRRRRCGGFQAGSRAPAARCRAGRGVRWHRVRLRRGTAGRRRGRPRSHRFPEAS